MTELRPEQPSDVESVDSGLREAQESDSKKRKRRKVEAKQAEQKAQESPEASSDDPGTPDDSEPAHLQAEAVAEQIAVAVAEQLREQVVLKTLAERLSPEQYRAVERFLAGTSGQWRLERRRHLFTHLARDREVPVADRPVRIIQRLAIARETAPLEPEEIDRKITERVRPNEPAVQNVPRLEMLSKDIPPGDEVRITLAPDQPEIIVTSETAELTQPDELLTTERTPVIETGPPPDVQMVERAVDATELEIDSELETPETALETIDSEISLESAEREPQPAVASVMDVLELLDREAVSVNDLSPIRGGAEEADSDSHPEEPEEVRPETEEEVINPEETVEPVGDRPDIVPPPLSAEPRRLHPHPRRRHRQGLPDLIRWEPGWAEPVRLPDYQMRKSGRKLIRRLAAEYGVKLTPEMEAYLLAILLRPHLVNGRRVYGLRLNLPTLVGTMQVLKYQFNLTWRPRA